MTCTPISIDLCFLHWNYFPLPVLIVNMSSSSHKTYKVFSTSINGPPLKLINVSLMLGHVPFSFKTPFKPILTILTQVAEPVINLLVTSYSVCVEKPAEKAAL